MLLLPQLATHWLPHSVQTKYGSVCENWVTLGERPLEQTQEYVRVVASQVLAMVSWVLPSVSRQMLWKRNTLA